MWSHKIDQFKYNWSFVVVFYNKYNVENLNVFFFKFIFIIINVVHQTWRYINYLIACSCAKANLYIWNFYTFEVKINIYYISKKIFIDKIENVYVFIFVSKKNTFYLIGGQERGLNIYLVNWNSSFSISANKRW